MPRELARFTAFVVASLALHALLGAAVGGTGSVREAPRSTERTTLHAWLERASDGRASAVGETIIAQEQAPEPASGPRDDTHRANDASVSAQSRPGLELPALTKWYAAAELDVRAEPLTTVHLEYPHDIAGGAAGRVRLRLFIDERGTVVKSEVVASQPRGVFDDSARRAWQDVRFSPAMKDGVTVKSQKLLELDFLPF